MAVGFRSGEVRSPPRVSRAPQSAKQLVGPSPFLGSRSRRVCLPRRSGPMGLIGRCSKVSHLRGESITGGDVSPDRLMAFSRRLVSGSLIAGRRLPPCPPFLALHGYFFAWKSDSVSRAFSTFAGRLRVRRRKEIYGITWPIPKKFNLHRSAYPQRRANPCHIKPDTVHKSVEKLIPFYILD